MAKLKFLSPIYEVLIPGSTSPGRVGVVQTISGDLEVCSKCCDSAIRYIDENGEASRPDGWRCVSCLEMIIPLDEDDDESFDDTPGSAVGYKSAFMHDYGVEYLKDWLARWMGIDESRIELEIEE